MTNLKAVYVAVDEQAALNALDILGERWDKKYPKPLTRNTKFAGRWLLFKRKILAWLIVYDLAGFPALRKIFPRLIIEVRIVIAQQFIHPGSIHAPQRILLVIVIHILNKP